MSVILVISGLVFGAYLHQPMWFDQTPYHYVSSHKTLVDCEEAKRGHEVHGQEALCVPGITDSSGKLYVKYVKKVGMSEIDKPIMTGPSADTIMNSHWSE